MTVVVVAAVVVVVVFYSCLAIKNLTLLEN
jgi:hypothetical protein